MRRNLALIPLFLVLAAPAAGEEPGGPNVSYSAGLAISLEEGSQPGRFYITVASQGRIQFRNAQDDSFTMTPRLAFVWNTDGSFEKTQLDLANRVIMKGMRVAGQPIDVNVKPVIVMGAPGQGSFLILPNSLLPSISGIDVDRIPQLPKQARALIKSLAPSAPKIEFPMPVPSPQPESRFCDSRSYDPILDWIWMRDMKHLRLDDPTRDFRLPAQGEDALFGVRSAWQRYQRGQQAALYPVPRLSLRPLSP